MKLIDQVRVVIRKKHYSYRTEQAYVEWIKRFIYFNDKRHPKDISEKEIARFISHLAINRKVAARPAKRFSLSVRERNSILFRLIA